MGQSKSTSRHTHTGLPLPTWILGFSFFTFNGSSSTPCLYTLWPHENLEKEREREKKTKKLSTLLSLLPSSSLAQGIRRNLKQEPDSEVNQLSSAKFLLSSVYRTTFCTKLNHFHFHFLSWAQFHTKIKVNKLDFNV